MMTLLGLNTMVTVPAGKLRKTEQPMTTVLFMLRNVQLRLSTSDFDLVTMGTIYGMINERSRDSMD